MKTTYQLVIVFCFLCIANIAHATTCTFAIEGNLAVRSEFTEIKGQLYELPNAEVRLSSYSSKSKLWNVWDQIRADEKGHFAFWKRMDDEICAYGTRLRIEVKFSSDYLEVHHENAINVPSDQRSKWYTAFDSEHKAYRNANFNLEPVIFERNGHFDLGKEEALRHANIWMLFNRLNAYLRSIGKRYAFEDKIYIKYPHSDIPEEISIKQQSYTDALYRVVYLYKDKKHDDFSMPALLRRIMNVWSYEHDAYYPEDKKPMAVVDADANRDNVETASEALHMAFARYASEALIENIFGRSLAELPHNRPYINRLKENSKAELYNSWVDTFRVLSLKNIEQYDFGRVGDNYSKRKQYAEKNFGYLRCNSSYLSLRDIMKVFFVETPYFSDIEKGHDKFISTKDIDRKSFFNKATEILDNFTPKQADIYYNILDVNNTKQPKDYVCG